jgi:hypothetical protein
MLTPREREKIIHAVKQWAETAPNQPIIGFLNNGGPFRPREIVDEIVRNTPAGEDVMEILEHSVRREGLDKVLGRLTARNVASSH